LSSRRILIADDTEFFRQSFAETFRGDGHEVLLAVDGLDAVQQFRRSADTLDLVVLDLLMPKMTGYDVIRAIRHSPAGRRMPVLVISEVANQADTVRRLVEAGANAHLAKSTSGPELLASARALLADPRLRPRRQRRASCDLPVFLEVGEESYDFVAVDLSTGGLGVSGHVPGQGLPERLLARFGPPGLGDALGVTVRLAWTGPADEAGAIRAGLEFISLPPRATLAIAEYVAGSTGMAEPAEAGGAPR